MRNQREKARHIKFVFIFFESVLSSPEPTSVSDGTGGSIVSEVISSTGRGALCAGDSGRKMEVSWATEKKKKCQFRSQV